MMTKTSTTFHGMKIVGTVITGDWEGDPSVPGGINPLGPYVDSMEVFLYDRDGEKVDIYEYLSEEAIVNIEKALIEEAANDYDWKEDYKNDLIREDMLSERWR